MTDRHIIPNVRRGIVRSVTTVDPLDGGIPAATVDIDVEVGGVTVSKPATLLGANAVTALDAGAIRRRWPSPGSTDVETNFFPIVEFDDADLPWRYTPAASAGNAKLRPWLVLVVVDTATDVALEATDDGHRLVVPTTELDQLPPGGETWAWAHAQSTVSPDRLEEALVTDPSAAISRLVCPRILEPARQYLAAVVRAFVSDGAGGLTPAWTNETTSTVTLDVFDHWTFSTAAADGDFESLCELLGPADAVSDLGVTKVDFTANGLGVEMKVDRVAFALQDVGTSLRAPGATTKFGDAVETVLERVPDPGRGRNAGPDPVLGLPLYGGDQASTTSLPKDLPRWLRYVNRRPDRRLAAGVGAEVVRANQEEFVAAAWDHAQQVREARDIANRTRLAAEIDRTTKARVDELESGPRLTIAAPTVAHLRVGDESAVGLLARSRTPNAVLERAWLRSVPTPVSANVTNVYVRATEPAPPPEIESALAVFDHGEVGGMAPPRPVDLDDSVDLGGQWEVDLDAIGGTIDRVDISVLDRLAVNLPNSPVIMSSVSRVVVAPPSSATIADAVTARSAVVAWRDALARRVPAVAAQLPADELRSNVVGAPRFDDGLISDLVALDPELLLPGLGEFPENGVRLVEVNEPFVTSFLVGANHELGRELLWRGFPVDRTATFFPRFFDHHDGTDDIDPIAEWDPTKTLGPLLVGGSTTTVLVVRGAIVRRFPELTTFVAPATGDAPDLSAAVSPIFRCQLDAGTACWGFPVSPETLLGTAEDPPWYVAFEERFDAVRFGLDLTGDAALTTWSELHRGHFRDLGTHVPATRVPGHRSPKLDGVKWGRNSAHLAAATSQPPYRRLYPAPHLAG